MEQDLQGLEFEVREMQTVWQNAQSGMKKHIEVLNREKRNISQLEAEIQNIE